MIDKQKWEDRAKEFDQTLPNLAAALRSEDVQRACSDISEFYGWIRCKSSEPRVGEMVLVTDGNSVWMGEMSFENRKKVWSIVFDGSPPFLDTDIIAWMYMPVIPPDLTPNRITPQTPESK